MPKATLKAKKGCDFIRSRCKPIAVPVAIPHMKLSRTHHRKGLFCTASRIPNASGNALVQPPVTGPASETIAALSLLDIFRRSTALMCRYYIAIVARILRSCSSCSLLLDLHAAALCCMVSADCMPGCDLTGFWSRVTVKTRDHAISAPASKQ